MGRHLGPRLLEWGPVRRHGARISSAQQTLARRGGWAVLLARGVAFLRAVMPALAGSSGMRYRTFAAFNVVGGLLWGVAVVLVGFLAGHSYRVVERELGAGAAAVAVVAVVVALVVRHVRARRRESRDRSAASVSGRTTDHS